MMMFYPLPKIMVLLLFLSSSFFSLNAYGEAAVLKRGYSVPQKNKNLNPFEEVINAVLQPFLIQSNRLERNYTLSPKILRTDKKKFSNYMQAMAMAARINSVIELSEPVNLQRNYATRALVRNYEQWTSEQLIGLIKKMLPNSLLSAENLVLTKIESLKAEKNIPVFIKIYVCLRDLLYTPCGIFHRSTCSGNYEPVQIASRDNKGLFVIKLAVEDFKDKNCCCCY